MDDCWRVASLHRSAFYPSSAGPLAAFLEWDKATGLEFLLRTPPADGGRYVVLLAEAEDGRVLATVRARMDWSSVLLGVATPRRGVSLPR
jgi:hypothetical protein